MAVPPRKQKTNGRVGPLEHAEKRARRTRVETFREVIGFEKLRLEEAIDRLTGLPRLPGGLTEYLEVEPIDVLSRARIGVVVTTAAHEDLNLRMMLDGWAPLLPKGSTSGTIDGQLLKTQLYARRLSQDPRRLLVVPVVFPYIDAGQVLDPIKPLKWLKEHIKGDDETRSFSTAWTCHLNRLVHNYIANGAKGGGVCICDDPSDFALARTLPKKPDEILAYALEVY